MQGRGGTINSFLDTVDIDQGAIPNNTSMSQRNSLNNMLNPVDSRLANYAVNSSGAVRSSVLNDEVQSFNGWNSGEPSTRINLENQVNDDKMECGWSSSSSYSVHTGPPSRSDGRQTEPTNILFPERVTNRQSGNRGRNGAAYLQGSSSNHIPQNFNLNEGNTGSSASNVQGIAASIGPNFHNSSVLERELKSNAFDNVGSSSGSSNYMMEEDSSGSCSALGSWGLSCKRKALEGTSRQFEGSSSLSQHAENGAWHTLPGCNDAANILSLSTPSQVNPPDQPNLRVGSGFRDVATEVFPSSSVRRTNVGSQQESLLLSLSPAAVSRRSIFSSSNQSSSVAVNSSSQNQPQSMHISAASSSMPPFRRASAFGSRAGNPSLSIGDIRGVGSQEEASLRNISRNNAENPILVPSSDTRNGVQDPAGWTLASGNNITSSGGVASTQSGTSSSINPPPHRPWVSLHLPPTQSQQRFPEFSPWSLFQSFDSEAATHGGNFPHLPTGPSSSSQEAVGSSGASSQGNNQPYSRSGILWERQGDEFLGMPHSMQALAADIEGRHRLISEIRQVLNAMRRGENLRIEDYMLFDPLIYHGMAEMHDRHRDMRLDVDNMSYEELLALEEQIGDVSTGLSEETIFELMKQQKYMSIATRSSSPDVEPCCVCQEEYVDGDDLGILDCGHEFHTSCIKQWLTQKNLCPVCKTTALRK